MNDFMNAIAAVDAFMEVTKDISTLEFESAIADLILTRFEADATHKAEMITDRIATIQRDTAEQEPKFNYLEQRQLYCHTRFNCGDCDIFKNFTLEERKLPECLVPTETNVKIVKDWCEGKDLAYTKHPEYPELESKFCRDHNCEECQMVNILGPCALETKERWEIVSLYMLRKESLK